MIVVLFIVHFPVCFPFLWVNMKFTVHDLCVPYLTDMQIQDMSGMCALFKTIVLFLQTVLIQNTFSWSHIENKKFFLLYIQFLYRLMSPCMIYCVEIDCLIPMFSTFSYGILLQFISFRRKIVPLCQLFFKVTCLASCFLQVS